MSWLFPSPSLQPSWPLPAPCGSEWLWLNPRPEEAANPRGFMASEITGESSSPGGGRGEGWGRSPSKRGSEGTCPQEHEQSHWL